MSKHYQKKIFSYSINFFCAINFSLNASFDSEGDHQCASCAVNLEQDKSGNSETHEAKETFLSGFKEKQVDKVTLQIIDKISGDVFCKVVKVNETAAFKRLRVVVRNCFASPDDKEKNFKAYVEIYEVQFQGGLQKIYSSWMFTENISMNIFEHPIYCVTILRD